MLTIKKKEIWNIRCVDKWKSGWMTKKTTGTCGSRIILFDKWLSTNFSRIHWPFFSLSIGLYLDMMCSVVRACTKKHRLYLFQWKKKAKHKHTHRHVKYNKNNKRIKLWTTWWQSTDQTHSKSTEKEDETRTFWKLSLSLSLSLVLICLSRLLLLVNM